MAHSEKCPICHGVGKIEGKTCHGCFGRGWIEVRDEHIPLTIPKSPDWGVQK